MINFKHDGGAGYKFKPYKVSISGNTTEPHYIPNDVAEVMASIPLVHSMAVCKAWLKDSIDITKMLNCGYNLGYSIQKYSSVVRGKKAPRKSYVEVIYTLLPETHLERVEVDGVEYIALWSLTDFEQHNRHFTASYDVEYFESESMYGEEDL